MRRCDRRGRRADDAVDADADARRRRRSTTDPETRRGRCSSGCSDRSRSSTATDGRRTFERSKTLELIAWLALHRDRSTRAGARTALWELDVRDATFANVVSEARRAMARLVEPPRGEEWLGRTLTDVLPLHRASCRRRPRPRTGSTHARLQPPELAIETLRPAVELIRDMPFAGTGYLWPDAEGITSNLVLLATSAATELAGHYLSMGDIDGVFWATGQGLKVLPGHEELIALRMRAHARAGDLSGVRLEWESYERVLNADPWSDGEPAPKLVLLRRSCCRPRGWVGRNPATPHSDAQPGSDRLDGLAGDDGHGVPHRRERRGVGEVELGDVDHGHPGGDRRGDRVDPLGGPGAADDLGAEDPAGPPLGDHADRHLVAA